MELIAQILGLLSSDFGLGLSVVLLAAVWKLMRYISSQHAERVSEQQESIALLEGVKNWLESNERAFTRFAEKVEASNLKIERLSDRVASLSEKIE